MTQPEALRLADELGAELVRTVAVDMLHHNAAAELRRLHAENAALREANDAFGKHQEWWDEKMFALEQQRDALMEALKYHQEQTRPIQRSIDVIKTVQGDNNE